MTCPADSLYQLELVVRSVKWYGRPDDGKCGATVGVRFLDNAEQTVCEIPAALDSDGTAAVVNAGKTFTFAVPPGGCPKPVRLDMRLCRAAGETIASGELCVTPAASCGRPATGCDDERSVPMTDCCDGRTVAVLTVRARAWNAGTVTVTSVEPPAWPTDADGKKTASCPPEPKPPGCPPEPKPPCCRPEPKPPCYRPEPKPPCFRPEPKPSPCCPRQSKPSPCCPREPKPSACCPTRATCRRPCATCCRRTTVVQPQQQYTSLGCEIDGRKIDLRVRKKNYETCAVQRLIANEAEEFATRVVEVVKEMHGLITNTIIAKKCPANELTTDITFRD